MANDHFRKRIILLNKEKVRPLVNIKSDKFLKEVVALNILLLWKCKAAVLCTTGATLYGNRYFLVAKLLDVSLLIKHIADNSILEEKLSQCRAQNSNILFMFIDLFTEKATHFSIRIPISRYVHEARGNWDNYKMGPTPVAIDNKTGNNDASNKDAEGPPDNDLDELYGVYNEKVKMISAPPAQVVMSIN